MVQTPLFPCSECGKLQAIPATTYKSLMQRKYRMHFLEPEASTPTQCTTSERTQQALSLHHNESTQHCGSQDLDALDISIGRCGGCTCSQRMLTAVRRSTWAAALAAGAGACCSRGTVVSGRSSELSRLLWGVNASAHETTSACLQHQPM